MIEKHQASNFGTPPLSDGEASCHFYSKNAFGPGNTRRSSLCIRLRQADEGVAKWQLEVMKTDLVDLLILGSNILARFSVSLVERFAIHYSD